jgi:glycosyltransferase involved in cell wall biosynthesis
MASDSGPLVSIGVASYNCSKYILDTLDSIRLQTYRPIELIVVDDLSTENNPELITQWIGQHNMPCKFIRHKANTGVVKTCNDLLKNATGEYFVLIGSDDVMKPTRVAAQLAFMQQEGYDVVLSDMTVIDAQSAVIQNSYFRYIDEGPKTVNGLLSLPVNERLAFTIRKNIFPSPAMIYRTAVLKELGGWDENLVFEDWDMILRLIAGGYKFGFLNKNLVEYRVLNSSLARVPNPRFTDSLLTLVSKYQGLSAPIDRAIADQINEKSMQLYFAGHRSARKWLYKKWRNQPTLKNFLYWVKARVKG